MYKLFYYPSNANLAPHILLEEIGAPYELMLVDRDADAHKSAAYLRLNPSGRIPTLVDGDFVLFEAAAICLHLIDRHPEAGLAPEIGSDARGRFYQWLIYLTNTVQAEQLVHFYPERYSTDPAAAQDVQAKAEARIGSMFDILSEALADGPYLLGGRYSAADIYLLMICRWSKDFADPPRARANLNRFIDKMLERPAVDRAFRGERLEPPFA